MEACDIAPQTGGEAVTTWDEDVQMWRVEVVNRHNELQIRWFRSWHRAERYRMHIEQGGDE